MKIPLPRNMTLTALLLPLAALEGGIDWGWRSFGEWLDRPIAADVDGGASVALLAGWLRHWLR